jgi:hypothetical protein
MTISRFPPEDGEKDRIMTLLGNGEKKAEQDIPLIEFPFNVNKHLVSSLACGTKSQYEDSRHVIENIRSKMDRSKVSFVFQSCFPGTVCFKYHLDTSIISPNNKIVK